MFYERELKKKKGKKKRDIKSQHFPPGKSSSRHEHTETLSTPTSYYKAEWREGMAAFVPVCQCMCQRRWLKLSVLLFLCTWKSNTKDTVTRGKNTTLDNVMYSILPWIIKAQLHFFLFFCAFHFFRQTFHGHFYVQTESHKSKASETKYKSTLNSSKTLVLQRKLLVKTNQLFTATMAYLCLLL